MMLGQVGYLCLVLASAGCTSARTGFVTPFALRDHQWRQAYGDTSYVVSLDVALSFKTVLTTIFLDNGPPIAQIGGGRLMCAKSRGGPCRLTQ